MPPYVCEECSAHLGIDIEFGKGSKTMTCRLCGRRSECHWSGSRGVLFGREFVERLAERRRAIIGILEERGERGAGISMICDILAERGMYATYNTVRRDVRRLVAEGRAEFIYGDGGHRCRSVRLKAAANS